MVARTLPKPFSRGLARVFLPRSAHLQRGDEVLGNDVCPLSEP